MTTTYPFKNIVFEGGGMRGLAYLGVAEVIDQYQIDQQIERVAGTSAGSILAAIISLRLSPRETVDTFNSLDFAKVNRDELHEDFTDLPGRLKKDLDTPLNYLEIVPRLNKRFGLFALSYLYTWLQEIIAEHCAGNGQATFADFRKQGLLDLNVVASNLSKHEIQVFSAETTPDAPVAAAVRMSMSIPFVFEALQFDGKQFGQGDWYVDGGLFKNYPIDIFDHPRYMSDKSLFLYGVNWETLGCHLYTPDDCEGRTIPITNIPSYGRNLFNSLLTIQKVRFEKEPLKKLRSININDCCALATDFSITPDSEKYNELIEAGKIAAKNYLDDYRLPDEETIAQAFENNQAAEESNEETQP